MIFCAETPIDVREDRLVLEVFCAEYTAAYTNSSFSAEIISEEGSL
jgi:hypothetical protein